MLIGCVGFVSGERLVALRPLIGDAFDYGIDRLPGLRCVDLLNNLVVVVFDVIGGFIIRGDKNVAALPATPPSDNVPPLI